MDGGRKDEWVVVSPRAFRLREFPICAGFGPIGDAAIDENVYSSSEETELGDQRSAWKSSSPPISCFIISQTCRVQELNGICFARAGHEMVRTLNFFCEDHCFRWLTWLILTENSEMILRDGSSSTWWFYLSIGTFIRTKPCWPCRNWYRTEGREYTSPWFVQQEGQWVLASHECLI